MARPPLPLLAGNDDPYPQSVTSTRDPNISANTSTYGCNPSSNANPELEHQPTPPGLAPYEYASYLLSPSFVPHCKSLWHACHRER